MAEGANCRSDKNYSGPLPDHSVQVATLLSFSCRLVLDLLIPEVATAESADESLEAPARCELPERNNCRTLDESCSWASQWWDSVRCRLPVVGEHFPLGLVCVDELHFVGDPQRGHILEIFLAKLIFLNRTLKRPIQLVGMSATLPNAKQVCHQFTPLICYQLIPRCGVGGSFTCCVVAVCASRGVLICSGCKMA